MRSRLHTIPKAAVGVIGLTLAATISYQARELAAALLIFSFVFGAVGAVLLVLILIQEAALRGVAGIETRVVRVTMRHSLASARRHASGGAFPRTR